MSVPTGIIEAVDEAEFVDLMSAATRIPSVTPDEAEFASWGESEMRVAGWDDVELSDIGEGRPNVYGRTGEGDGRSVLLAGHLDTVHADDWSEHWSGTARADPFEPVVIDREVWGRGVADQKGGICMILAALRSIARAGYRPTGRVDAMFVCDEESGQAGSGVSAGMRAAVAGDLTTRPDTPDFLIYTEPTTSAIYTAQMGFLIAEIALTGRSAYFGRPELGVDALRAGHELLNALWEHSTELEHGERYNLIGNGFLLVTSVNSGGNIAVPGDFDLSLIRKILPAESMDSAAAVIHEIANRVARDHDVQVTVAFTAPRDHTLGGTPDEVDPSHPGVQALAKSIAPVTGEACRIEAAPFWSEKSFLSALGVPGVYFAAGDISDCHTPFEHVVIDEVVAATKTLVHFIASWCGLEELPKQTN